MKKIPTTDWIPPEPEEHVVTTRYRVRILLERVTDDTPTDRSIDLLEQRIMSISEDRIRMESDFWELGWTHAYREDKTFEDRKDRDREIRRLRGHK